ncbi:MAG: glycosyltransferase [Elusimicrobia bacterium]|jgi:glycosyltransferase involved in cell wall biosynthesis|nr:glycosyltransferase [Elusimicrobiota bacterium]
MKILYLVGFYPEIGGPFISILNLLKKISQKNIEIKVLSPIPKNYDINKLEFIKELPYEVEYFREDLPRSVMPSFSSKLLKRIMEESKNYDLIHLNGIFDSYAIFTFFINKPYVLSPRGTFMIDAYNKIFIKKIKKNIFINIIGRRIVKKAKNIHLLTNMEKKDFLSFFPKYENKIKVIPNGLNLNNFNTSIVSENLIKKFPAIKNKKLILYLSRINWKKGLDLLFPAFTKLVKENSDYHLLMAGDDDGDDYTLKMKNLVKELGILDSVTFTGLLVGEDKIEAFKRAEIFVLPSYSENFGVAIIEAMAWGVPIVISNKVGVYDDVEKNKAGIIVETNIESVYYGMKTLLENNNLRIEISKNAQKMVKEYYDIDKVTDNMIKMYEEVLKI